MDRDLKQEIERAASTLLTDDEICLSVGITKQQLAEHAEVVERTRVLLKQRLNAKRINDAATTGDPSVLVASIPRTKISSRGGYRPGSGRPKGSTNKISAAQLLASIEQETGADFGTLLAKGYAESIENNDQSARLQYERLFLSKVIADKVEIDLNESEDTVKYKQQAFEAALAALGQNKDAK